MLLMHTPEEVTTEASRARGRSCLLRSRRKRLAQGPTDIPLVVIGIVSIAARDIERALFAAFRMEQHNSPVDRETKSLSPVARGAM